MKFEIREFTPDDYAEMAQLVNGVYPGHRMTAALWQHDDDNRHADCRWRRFVAVSENRIVGIGSYQQNIWTYHPQKFHTSVEVQEDQRCRGIGTALYNHVLQALEPLKPIALRSRTREDLGDGVRFLTKQGFCEVDRDWESHIDPGTVNLAAYAHLEEELEGEGISIKTLAELCKTDADYARKIYELDWVASQDSPSIDPLTRPPFDDYTTNVLQNPELLPDAWFVAVHDGNYVGTSNLWANDGEGQQLHTGFTGVHPQYRRRGIALALKVRAIAYATAHGCQLVKTWNNHRNRGMLTINERLGFVKETPWISFAKELTSKQRQAESASAS